MMRSTRHNMSEARRIIEALRCGVPGAHAVAALGCRQPGVEHQFDRLLAQQSSVPAGLLLKGGFGAGKSHTLEHLCQRAAARGFVCSKITINKETPLHDPVKLFRAAAESASLQGQCGNAIRALATTIDFSGKRYCELREWARSINSGLDGRLWASLAVFESAKSDAEMRDRMVQFWMGDPLGVPYVRDCLRKLRPGIPTDIRTARQRNLALQKFQLVSRLVLSAGCSGWVLLVDEVELVGSYSVLQRAKYYAELASLAGRAPAFTCPNFVVVFAITDDFDAAVLEGKADLTKVPALLKERVRPGEEDVAQLASIGMKLIRSGAVILRSPDEGEIRQLYETVKRFHAEAYSWSPPDATWPQQLTTTRIRQYVKRWITEWDMRRLYPSDSIDVEHLDLRTDYTEDPEIEGTAEAERKSPIDELLERLL